MARGLLDSWRATYDSMVTLTQLITALRQMQGILCVFQRLTFEVINWKTRKDAIIVEHDTAFIFITHMVYIGGAFLLVV